MFNKKKKGEKVIKLYNQSGEVVYSTEWTAERQQCAGPALADAGYIRPGVAVYDRNGDRISAEQPHG